MLKKINPFVTLSLAVLGVTLIYVLWTGEDGHDHDHEHGHGHDHAHHHDHDHDHDHEHEEFVTLTPDQIQDAGIEIRIASNGTLERVIRSPGKIALNADRLAHIYPKVPGIAKEARKNMGETVQAGEVLALLESREIAEAKSDYLTALKKHQLKQTLRQQEQNLQDKKISSLQDYQNAINSAEEAQIELELSKQKLRTLGLTEADIASLPDTKPSKLRIYELHAPFNGTVLDRHITIGEQLATDNEVYVLSDLSNLWVEINLYPQDLPYVKKGQKVQISNSDGKIARAEIIYLSPIIEDETRRAKAIALLDNSSGEWFPGTFVTVVSTGEKTSVPLVISKDAIQKMDGQDCAFISTEEGFEIRPVKTGRCDGKNIEVLSGIERGEKYASKNTFLLKAEHEKDEAEHMH